MASLNLRKGNGRQSDPLSTVTPTEKIPDCAVLLCGELAELGSGLPLQELSAWLEGTIPGVSVSVVSNLCHAPREVPSLIPKAAIHLVLGLCSSEFAEAEMQSLAKRAGLDPYGIESANLGLFCAREEERRRGTQKAKLLLAAAVAKARASSWVGPDNLKPYFLPLEQKVNRRALFTLPPIRYSVVASIHGERCVAEAGCTLCVQACPRGALVQADGKVVLDKTRCEGCGLCLAACPKEAIQLPGSSPLQLEAQIGALLDTAAVSVGERQLLFACRQAVEAIERALPHEARFTSSWLPVVVPCVGMIPIGTILQCVARGAAIGMLPCAESCPLGQSESIGGRIDYCREALRRLGMSEGWIRFVSVEEGLSSERPIPEVRTTSQGGHEAGNFQQHMFGPKVVADALCRLAMHQGAAPPAHFEHPASPLGLVAVDQESCTGCGVCATVCFSEALRFRQDEGEVALTFDPRLCIGCDQCVRVCPEASAGAIQVDRVTDIACLAVGKSTVYQEHMARCKNCGGPVASWGMLKRISALMEGGDTALISRITGYCQSCRGAN